LQYKAVKGFKDILPYQVGTWNRIESEAKRIFELFGYREIRIPVLEKAELFARGIGQDTDIVSKEMYTLKDRKGNYLAMRPEATASVMRAYIEHKLYNVYPIQKLFTIGPMFRYERPQKGRRRQFHQINVEIIGDPGPRSDSELIFMIMHLFSSLGLNDLILNVNSLGCLNCRGPFRTELKDYLKRYYAHLCPDCQTRMETNPLRVFDCKVETCNQIIKDAPSMLDFLCNECADHFDSVRSYLEELKLDFVVNSHLMRGLDYYTRTTFEVQGLKCEMEYRSLGLKTQMKHADRLNACKVLIVGEDELIKGKGIVRDMVSKEQIEIPLDNLVDELIGLLNR